MPVSRPVRLIGLLLILTAAVLLLVARGKAAAQTPDPAQVEEGARLYAENCAVCHGTNGEGRVGATLAKNWPSIRPDLTVRARIAQGIPGTVMPAWSEAHGGPLSEDQIDALVAFILTWQDGTPSNVPTVTPMTRPSMSPVPEVEGDPNQGAILFDQNCVVCHGPNGEGRVGATLAKDWPSIRPDLTVKARIEQGVPGSVMPAWSQDHGGPLSEGDVNHLVAFILAQPNAGSVSAGEGAPLAPEPEPSSWLSGVGGVLLLILLFVGIVAGAIIAQRR